MSCRWAIVAVGCFLLACAEVNIQAPPTDESEESESSGHPYLTGKIINGSTFPPEEFNFIVSLRENNRHLCAGSLLFDNKTVITGAHCVFKNGRPTSASSLSVAVGIRKRTTVPSPNVIQVKKVIVHPSYDGENILNDIAVLRLERSVAGMSSVSTVKLPSYKREPSVGTLLHTAGWGIIYEGMESRSRYGSQTLLKTTLKVISRQQCSSALGVPIPITQVCTENQNSGTCKGDGGGPLVNRRRDGDYLVGLTSYGLSQCRLGTANAFTNVSQFVYWIQRVANGDFPAGAEEPNPNPGDE